MSNLALTKHGNSSRGCAGPRQEDVVFGRGRPIIERKGNRQLHALADKYRSLYKSFDCKSAGVVLRKKKYGFANKREIIDKIIDETHKRGSRFMKQDMQSLSWVEVDISEARLKVSHLLRDKPSKGGLVQKKEKKKKPKTSDVHDENPPPPRHSESRGSNENATGTAAVGATNLVLEHQRTRFVGHPCHRPLAVPHPSVAHWSSMPTQQLPIANLPIPLSHAGSRVATNTFLPGSVPSGIPQGIAGIQDFLLWLYLATKPNLP